MRHYKRLIGKESGTNLKKVLENILDRQKENKKDLVNLNSLVTRIQEDGQSHVQKIGFVRFNPFNETGGDNSFTISILDGKLNGVVLTGLHTREKTRVYAKPITKGKSNYELSKEEKKAVET